MPGPSKSQIVLSVVLHAVLVLVWLAVHFTAMPFERGFYCDDKSILKPYKVTIRKTFSIFEILMFFLKIFNNISGISYK